MALFPRSWNRNERQGVRLEEQRFCQEQHHFQDTTPQDDPRWAFRMFVRCSSVIIPCPLATDLFLWQQRWVDSAKREKSPCNNTTHRTISFKWSSSPGMKCLVISLISLSCIAKPTMIVAWIFLSRTSLHTNEQADLLWPECAWRYTRVR